MEDGGKCYLRLRAFAGLVGIAAVLFCRVRGMMNGSWFGLGPYAYVSPVDHIFFSSMAFR